MAHDPFAPGSSVGGYIIEALAGRGGMGLVFRASQLRPARTVALKVIAPELADDVDFRARFERESLVAAEIEHPHVIPVYDVGEDNGILFIAMRYVDGVDLRRLRQQTGRFSPQRASNMISQVASALDAAHARGLVHRDVKPGNILVIGDEGDEHLYLTDFGLTRRILDSRPMTATGEFVGTIDYMAPEQARGERVDARTDIYALGCVLYELLAGGVPFPREADVAKIFAHLNDPAPSLRDRVPGITPELDEVVSRALAKDPNDRFHSASDFARAVSAAVVGRLDPRPERSVATGAAAPVGESTVISPTRPARADRPQGNTTARSPAFPPLAGASAAPALTTPPAGTVGPAAAASTVRIERDADTVPGSPARPSRRPWLLAIALVVVAAAASVTAAVLITGSHSGGGGTARNGSIVVAHRSASTATLVAAPIRTSTEVRTVTSTRNLTSVRTRAVTRTSAVVRTRAITHTSAVVGTRAITHTSAVTATRTVTRSRTVAPVVPQPDSGAVVALDNYWYDISTGNFVAAYGYIAPGAVNQTESQFVTSEEQSAVSGIRFVGQLGQSSPTSAIVNVATLITHDAQFGCRSWSGFYEMVFRGGGWLIEHSNISPQACSG